MIDIADAREIAAKAADERGQTTFAKLIRDGGMDDNPAVQAALSGTPIAASLDVDHSETETPPPANNPMVAVPNAGVEWPGA